MSFSKTYVSGKFARYVSAAAGMNSIAARTSHPAIFRPQEEPPHPEKDPTAFSPFRGLPFTSSRVGRAYGGSTSKSEDSSKKPS
jgi:hypothetical protein